MRPGALRLAVPVVTALAALAGSAVPSQAAPDQPGSPAGDAQARSWPCGFSHHKGIPQYGDWYFNCTKEKTVRITIKWVDEHVSWMCVEPDTAERLGDLNTVQGAWISALC